MASFINRTFAIPPSDEHPFEDVPRGSTHAAAINALAAADVARGTSDTTFDPGATVTRAQMASFLARAAGWDTSATQSRFSDVRAGSTHVGAIAAIDRVRGDDRLRGRPLLPGGPRQPRADGLLPVPSRPAVTRGSGGARTGDG
jgi:hypothetical protein